MAVHFVGGGEGTVTITERTNITWFTEGQGEKEAVHHAASNPGGFFYLDDFLYFLFCVRQTITVV